MTYKSSSGASTIKILRDMEDQGVTPLASASRASALIGYTCASDKALDFVGNLALDSRYTPWDVTDAVAAAKVESSQASSTAAVVLTESVYAAAFGDVSGMGKGFYYPSAGGASRSAVQAFREREYYGGNSAVVAATGIKDHAAFVESLAGSLGDYGSVATETPVSPYLGGEVRVPAPADFAQVALAFEAPSDSRMANILKHCLAASGVSAFVGEGIIGVYGVSDAVSAGALSESLANVLAAPISPETVSKAKAAAKSEALFGLEGGCSQTLAKSLTAGALVDDFSVASTASYYNSVTAQEVAAAQKAMTSTNLSVAAIGSIASVPYYGTLSSKFV
jgi:predicted Zn-dependent peptidase